MSVNEKAVDFDEIKKDLRSSLIPVMGNEEWLKDVPHKKIEDLALIYRLDFISNDEPFQKTTRVTVTNEIVENLGMSDRQFMEKADSVIPENDPPVLRNLTDVLGISGGDDAAPQIIVATNSTSREGAGVIHYQGVLDKATELLQGDFMVLPSSIHEVLLLKDDGRMTVEDLKEMVHSVNNDVVDPLDQLSDQVYHYDSREKVFELAEKFEERKTRDRTEERHSVLKELKNGREKSGHDRSDKPRKLSQEAR